MEQLTFGLIGLLGAAAGASAVNLIVAGVPLLGSTASPESQRTATRSYAQQVR
jgi:hypothetical protein